MRVEHVVDAVLVVDAVEPVGQPGRERTLTARSEQPAALTRGRGGGGDFEAASD